MVLRYFESGFIEIGLVVLIMEMWNASYDTLNEDNNYWQQINQELKISLKPSVQVLKQLS